MANVTLNKIAKGVSERFQGRARRRPGKSMTANSWCWLAPGLRQEHAAAHGRGGSRASRRRADRRQVVNRPSAQHRGAAMVFQNYALYPHMKVRDNLAFGPPLGACPSPGRGARQRRREAARDRALLDRYPRQLSAGRSQRVAVGRAIVKKPQVFLFDEPLSNLDAKLRASMRVRITELHQQLKAAGQPCTVIYVTHDQVEAMTMGERICVLKEGRIQQFDTPSKLYNAPANTFVASFIGSPEMNMLDATLTVAGGTVGETTLHRSAGRIRSRSARLESVLVKLGLRPENVLSMRERRRRRALARQPS